MRKIYPIKRRCGRHMQELHVALPKPPEELQVGDTFTITIENADRQTREVEVVVEIACGDADNDILYVA